MAHVYEVYELGRPVCRTARFGGRPSVTPSLRDCETVSGGEVTPIRGDIVS